LSITLQGKKTDKGVATIVMEKTKK